MLTRRVGSSLVLEHADLRARRLGLHAGMTLGQAQAIAPELVAFEHEAYRDHALLKRLAAWALRFSPAVQPVEPDTLLLDITGCQRLFGGEETIARQAHDGLWRQGFHTRAAIADTVGAAYALATAGSDAIVVAPGGQASAYLAPLPPAALRIDPGVVQQLETLGVRTIGDLLMLPRSSLPARFGPQLVRRLQQALGEVYEGVAAQKFEEPPAARIAFETPRSDLQTVQTAVAQLLEELFAQLRQRTLALRRVDCVLVYEQIPPTVLRIGLSRASRAWRHIAELVQRRLETVDLSPGVVGVRLVAPETSRWEPGQIDLFEPCEPEREEEFGGLLDRLINRLGYGAVVRAELVDDYQPERAFRYVNVGDAESVGEGTEKGFSVQRAVQRAVQRIGRLTRRRARQRVRPGQRRHRERSEESGIGRAAKQDSPVASLGRNDRRERLSQKPTQLPPTPTQLSPRPTRLLPRPLPIRVIALMPDGPPTWLALRGREHVVARAWGPERIETAWWRGSDVRREYFRVSVETGEQFWIYRDAGDGRWYLHGVFA